MRTSRATTSLLLGPGTALLVLLATLWIAASPATSQQPAPALPQAAADIGILRTDCRWEILPPMAAWPPDDTLPSRWILLLDQCSGRTWVLARRPGSPWPEWVSLQRAPR